ncbi:MAG: zinc-binding dehydrogenase [Chloroflexi bacterium]|nr:zinc-binding dehydrogenase [Chloroflexota bacterium]
MPLPSKRTVAVWFDDGHIRLIEQDVPELRPGSIAVDVRASSVSPGSEFSWGRDRREVMGGWRTLTEHRGSPEAGSEPTPYRGYSNAGIVIAVGEGVTRFAPGDRVACIGVGHAVHTDTAVVPHNLAVHLPEPVSYVEGSYGMLMGTALNALRRADLKFGETYAVVGLGVVGQLTAQLHMLAGNRVIGWDTVPFRTEIARKWGIDAAVTVGPEDPVARTREFTGGYGLDGGAIAFGGEASKAVQSLARCMKRTPDGHPVGPIVVVGLARFAYLDHEAAGETNIDIRSAMRTGPGYHDEAWESGAAYPPVLVRWTTTTNLELCMRLIAEGKLDVDTLITHVIPFADADAGISHALEDPDRMLGVVFTRDG